jgi:hypothetical protein
LAVPQFGKRNWTRRPRERSRIVRTIPRLWFKRRTRARRCASKPENHVEKFFVDPVKLGENAGV